MEEIEFFSRYDESEDCKSQYFVLDKDYTLKKEIAYIYLD